MRHKAIYALYSNVTSIDGDGDDAKAYDDEGNEVPWDADSVATKETEFQADYNALAYSRKREA